MREKAGDLAVTLLLLVFAVVMFVLTLDFPAPGQPNDPGTAAFPRMIAVALGALALTRLLRPGQTEPLPRGGAALRVGGILALLVVYAALFEALGFVIATMLFLLGAMLLAGIKQVPYLILVPVGVSLVLFYLFSELLEVSLPRGFVEGLLF